MNGQTEKMNHTVSVLGRKEMSITGVKEVESFDEGGVTLRTLGGDMTVEGVDIHIGVLDIDRGVVTLSGRIDGIFYSNDRAEEKRGLMSRLFR